MAQLHKIIKNEKSSNIKYALEDLERNKNDTIKMYESVKKVKRLAPKEKLSKQKKDLRQTKKNSQKS